MTHVVDSPPPAPPEPRRSFLTKTAALLVGGIVAIFPFAAGLGVLFDPLRRRTKIAADAADDEAVRYVRVGPLEVLPDDGTPHQFVLTDDVVDAWTRSPA